MSGTIKSCTCQECVGQCEANPGWMTPDEADAAIAAGLGPKLMRDWLEPDSPATDSRIYILCPASEWCEGEDAPEMELDNVFAYMRGIGSWTKGRCTFLSDDARCSIHNTSFKPIQCRLSLACGDEAANASHPDNYVVARLWDTDRGRDIVKRWMALVERESD